MILKIKAFAKINFFLEVIGKIKNSSYHEIITIMQSISLCDYIEIKPISESTIKIKGNTLKYKENSILKAANLFLKKANSNKGFLISCKKNIPSGAGLGGASADAAATLVGLNKIFGGIFSKKELLDLSKKIGTDVPFCIEGGCKIAKGIGEKLKSIDLKFGFFLVIIKPKISISTKKAYKIFDKNPPTKIKHIKFILNAIKNKNLNAFYENLYNRFEEVLSLDEIFTLKKKFLERGANAALLSGSGSCVFGIFENEDTAKKCFLQFTKESKKAFLTKTV